MTENAMNSIYNTNLKPKAINSSYSNGKVFKSNSTGMNNSDEDSFNGKTNKKKEKRHLDIGRDSSNYCCSRNSKCRKSS